MKKNTEKKLSLGKIKIASLSDRNQQSIKGGMINPTRTVCGICITPQTAGCTTGYLHCS